MREMSREQRREAFVGAAEEFFEEMEAWYDAHPRATFGEIEAEMRRQRRQFMDEAQAVIVNGRDTGYQEEPPPCPQCQGPMALDRYVSRQVSGLEADMDLERAYYRCPHGCGESLFPLDRKLNLRADSWSDGAARVATRMGMCASSYDQAAMDYADATGGSISATSIWRVVEQAGRALAQAKAEEARRVSAPAQRGEASPGERIERVDAVEGVANVSTDGGLIHLRGEGWKEVKMSTFSTVERRLDGETEAVDIRLSDHSYVATLGVADEFAPYQYAEGLRRGIDQAKTLSSVNDAAAWIGRITRLNFPNATQIIDWPHAERRLHRVARTVWGTGNRASQCVADQLSYLNNGDVAKILAAMRPLRLGAKEEVRTIPGYFDNNRSRMRYDHYRRQGLPIGSGTVESAVQHVVQHRMHRSGRGWKRQQATGMLALLGEYHSGRFKQTWRQIVAEPA